MRVTRRTLLAAPAAFAQGISEQTTAPGIRREVFRRSPAKGVAVMAYAFYTRPNGGAMTSIEQRWTRSDTVDIAYIRRSKDHGKTWDKPVEFRTGERRPEGMLRRHPRCGFVDKGSGRYIEFWTEGTLPSDDPLEGLRNWNIYYRIWRGDTAGPVRQVIHAGAEYNARHPLPNVWTGKNCVMLGDMTGVPVTAPDGGILLPVEITPLGADGKLHNPGGGYTYTDAALLLGRWQGERLEWTMSDLIQGDPAVSTRGMVEPTIEFLNDGRLLMILRASNDKKPELPSHRWACWSSDGGRRWTNPKPWTYEDGQAFFSPSSCSQLLRHSSGRLFWLGNLTPENPRGNRPRYPFVMAEVDRGTGLMQRKSVRVVDTLQAGEDPILTLSNFYAREDRRTREIALHMTRLFAHADGWAGDAFLYRIRLA
ncbi:MAG: exo-alpha-sialidase [Acidobacteriia bacterium]|nr:exo-alpha-sialidase [Terriglobia bacterium]